MLVFQPKQTDFAWEKNGVQSIDHSSNRISRITSAPMRKSLHSIAISEVLKGYGLTIDNSCIVVLSLLLLGLLQTQKERLLRALSSLLFACPPFAPLFPFSLSSHSRQPPQPQQNNHGRPSRRSRLPRRILLRRSSRAGAKIPALE